MTVVKGAGGASREVSICRRGRELCGLGPCFDRCLAVETAAERILSIGVDVVCTRQNETVRFWRGSALGQRALQDRVTVRVAALWKVISLVRVCDQAYVPVRRIRPWKLSR